MSRGTAYLDLTIDEEAFAAALGAEAHSGRCMIVQAIKAKYGPASRPLVDTDYIRFTNPASGDRLFYRTPPDAAAALISFDAAIKPKLPLHIRARIAYQRRGGRPANEAPLAEVRKWAATDPRFAGRITPKARIPAAVIDAFKADHPDKTVRPQGTHTKGVSSSSARKIVLPDSGAGAPQIGNLAGGGGGRGGPRIPDSRRRTWGSRTLTNVLIAQGWATPDGDGPPTKG